MNARRRAAAYAAALVLAVLARVAWAQLAESPNRECAICHVMWISDFKRDDVTPLIPYDPTPVEATGEQDVVSTKRMCFSCHDGFVLDSRDVWKAGGHSHPVGVVPDSDVRIPTRDGKTVFPMNADGKMYCGTCHTAHGVSWDQSESPVFLRMKNVDSSICVACHLDRSTGVAEGNHPLFEPVENFPEHLVAGGSKIGIGGSVTCQTCHRSHGADGDELTVVRNDSSQLCVSCHEGHAPESLAAANRDGTHPVNVPAPDGPAANLLADGARFGPGGAVVCESCHRPHGGHPGRAMLVRANDDSGLCTTCHVEQRTVAGSKHDIALLDPGERNVRGVAAGEGGVCSACHLPHGGTGPRMWARAAPHGADPLAAECLGCHSDAGIAADRAVGDNSHPLGALHRVAVGGGLPVFDAAGMHVVDGAGARVSCATCHDPHRWDPDDPAARAKPGEPGDGGNRFLRIAHGPDAKLCAACHEAKRAVVGSSHDLATLAGAPANAKGQTVAESGVCGACHVVHNALGRALWARADIDARDGAAAPCLSCHDRDGLAPKPDLGAHGHPLGVGLQRVGLRASRDAWTSRFPQVFDDLPLEPLPLYDDAGARQDHGGEMSCGTCHDPHAGPGAGHASEFLRIPADARDRLCINCHVDKRPLLASKHGAAELRAPPPGKSGHPVGACRACHAPHAAGEPFLWARGKGDGDGVVEQLCTDCHRPDGLAGKKVPGDHGHPTGMQVAGLGPPPELPLFPPAGHPRAAADRVDCGTCHDPHRWRPGKEVLAGAEEDGDGNSSFLRLPAAPSGELCVGCHRDKAPVRGTDHDLAVTAPDATNEKGQRVAASGVCGQCHLAHDSHDEIVLWARGRGGAGDAMQQLCTSCHAPDAAAHAKVPERLRHPPEVVAWTGAVRSDGPPDGDGLPLFGRDGHRAAAGVISCATCHDPHRWSAGSDAPGSGHNEEGDVRSSFLRRSDTGSLLCADCHGLDSLYRHKYFHGDPPSVAAETR